MVHILRVLLNFSNAKNDMYHIYRVEILLLSVYNTFLIW